MIEPFLKFSLTVLLLFVGSINANSQVIINEFMSDNTITVSDKEGEFSDWIELYNNGDTAIDLFNYSLSDKNDELDKWKFPEITIEAHGFLIVFASGKNILDANELHTNFKISSSGESLFLSNNFGQVIDQVEPIELSEDQSYGRSPDGSDNFFSLTFPTPSSSNDDNNKLTFTFNGGFYDQPFFQKINSITSDTIYYTLNGNIPTSNSNIFSDSLKMDYKYSSPNITSNIPTSPDQSLISFKAWEMPDHIIDKANILRYATYKNGLRTSPIYTHTYIVDSTIFEKYDMPILSLVTDSLNLFDHDTGIYIPGVHYDSLNPRWTGNYFQRGDDWEKPVHMEYFEKDGQLGFSQNAGMQIHGGKSRNHGQKSFKFYARNNYGKKYFDYPLMPQREHDRYKRFILRTTMGTWSPTLLHDIFAHEIARGIGLNFQDYRPVVVFINGEYWGIQTIRDRIDERYLAYSYGLDEDSVEIRGFYNTSYFDLEDFIESNDLSDNENYDFVKSKIDIENFIDYHITEMFLVNTDWPANNMELWKEKNPNGKWQWILYDLDGGFSDFEYNMFEHMNTNDSSIVHPNSPSSTFMFRNLIKNEEFTEQFINRYAELLCNDFHVDTLKQKLDLLIPLFEPEIPRHYARWSFGGGTTEWKKAIDESIINFIENRTCVVEKNLAEFFDITLPDLCCVDDEIKISNKEIVLAPNPNDGNFFIYNNAEEELNVDVVVTNIIGKTVYVKNDISLMEQEKMYFDFSHLPNNIYLLTLQNEEFRKTTKFILMHQ